MTEIIDLAHFARPRAISANTSFASVPSEERSWYRPVDDVSPGGFLSAGVLRKLDIDSELGRFVGLAQDAIERLAACQLLLGSGDPIGADDQFIACKPILTEMLMYRDLSDAVGLIALKCLQIASSVKVIVDATALPSVLERVLTRVRAAPFMSFEEACALADVIEEKASLLPLPGLASLASALAEASAAPSDAVEND